MNTIRGLLLVLTIMCCACFCEARLGDNELKCDLRYNPTSKRGAPSSEDKTQPLSIGQPLETVSYIYEGWQIRIGFLGGIARCMEYRKTNYTTPDGTEIGSILKANELGGTWQRISREQARTNAVLGVLWKYTGGNDMLGGYWLRSDGSIAYITQAGLGSTLRLEHKKGVDIGVKNMRQRETPKPGPAPKF